MTSNRNKISVIVITKNEERNIVDCFSSVAWAAEIVAVDANSTDKTVELARQFTNKVFVNEWLGYAAAKNFALERCNNPWILWLDADERVTPELAEEIQTTIGQSDVAQGGFEIARRAYFLGKWIRHCGWYPSYVVRLFKKENARFSDSRVHENLHVSGSVGRLKHDLVHFTDENLFHYFSKFNRYTTLAAEDAIEAGKKFALCDLLIRPPFLFFKMYILRLGILDGMHGLVLSLLSAAYVYVKYAKLWEFSVLRKRTAK